MRPRPHLFFFFKAKTTSWEHLSTGEADPRFLPEAAGKVAPWDTAGVAGATGGGGGGGPEPIVPLPVPLPRSASVVPRSTDTHPWKSCFQTRILYSRESGLAVTQQPLRGSWLHGQPRAPSLPMSLRGAGGDALTVKNNIPARAVTRCQERRRGQAVAEAPRPWPVSGAAAAPAAACLPPEVGAACPRGAPGRALPPSPLSFPLQGSPLGPGRPLTGPQVLFLLQLQHTWLRGRLLSLTFCLRH